MRYMEPVSWRDNPEESEESRADLMEKLEALIKESDPECASYVDKLKSIPGSDELISNLKNYDLEKALISLNELKEKEQD